VRKKESLKEKIVDDGRGGSNVGLREILGRKGSGTGQGGKENGYDKQRGTLLGKSG